MESYGNKRYSSGILCYDERACGGEEDFAVHVDRTLPLIVRDGRNSLCVRVLCTRNDVRLGNFKGHVDLGERNRSPFYHSVRRTFAPALYRPRHRALVDVDLVGARSCRGIGSGRRRAGLSYWLRPRSRIRRVRETAALVNYAHRLPGRSGRRIILSRLRHRTFADDWSRTLLVGHNSAGCFFTWPLVRGAANILIALAAGIILTGFYLWRRDLVANMIGHGLVDFVANVLPKLFS